VRLSSDACPYCRVDQPQYKRLLEKTTRAGCTSVILAPKAGQLRFKGDGSGTKHLQFIGFDLGLALNPFSTPQTILLDRGGRVMWYREGTMDDRALSRATSALGEVR
jgi:hypothetical protein